MPGISVSKIPIPFRSAGGISWSSYWATLISATVETAAPTHVVLTFPTAASLTAADFTMDGFTISSASWTGAVLTLVIAEPVTVFHGDLVLTFDKTGTDTTVTNNVADDGNTIAWYNHETDLTLSGSDVTAWGNKAGAANDLTIAAGYPVTTADGVFCNKTKKAVIGRDWTLNQPSSIYLYCKFEEQTNGRLFDCGDSLASGTIGFRGDAKDDLYMTSDNSNFLFTPVTTFNVFSLVRGRLNGANSTLQYEDNAYGVSGSGNAGTGASNGIRLGGRADRYLSCNVTYKDVIVRGAADSDPVYDAIGHGIRYRNGFFLT